MMFRTKAPLLAVSALVSAFGFASTAYADAFYLQAQSARGAGRAFSGEAADTGAASLRSILVLVLITQPTGAGRASV